MITLMRRFHVRIAICGAAVAFGTAGWSIAADQLYLEARTLSRDGTNLAVVLPTGPVVLSSKVVGACLSGSRNPDDILEYDLKTGECRFIPANERPAAPALQRPSVASGELAAATKINECLASHRGVVIKETSEIALCFDWYTCNDLTPTILGEDSVCAGYSIILDAGGGFASYLWEPSGETTQSVTVSPLADTPYAVTVSDDWLCTGADVHAVIVTPLPEPVITGPTEVCEGASVTLHAGVGFAWYLWEPGGETTQTIEVTPLVPTSFNVTVSDSNGCTAASAEHFIDVTVCVGGIFADNFETGDTSRWSKVVP